LKALVVGYGSIGARHARLLTDLGCDVAVVSARAIDFPRVYGVLRMALETHRPDYVIIANSTDLHHQTLTELIGLGYLGTVLVEKPMFAHVAPLPAPPLCTIFVAYNLRFHPIIRSLRAMLESQRILSVDAYVGQYLPDWRPDRNYRTSYSAEATKGGGVLRDLSHELDYLTWILGGWRRVSALGGKLSSLQIDSADVFAILLSTPACSVVTVQLNYVDRRGRRTVIVNTDECSMEADLISGTLTVDRNTEAFNVERDDTYRMMHAAVLAGDTQMLCTVEEGLRTMKLIEASERAAARGEWVTFGDE
jgi:predicted dehydrogenase